MAVKLRLKRMGSKQKPFYRIVAADSRSPRDGRFIEEVGYYNPITEPAEAFILFLKISKQVSSLVISLLTEDAECISPAIPILSDW